MAPAAGGEEGAAVAQNRLTEVVVSRLHTKVRGLAQERYTDKEELESWLGKFDSGLQKFGDLQERENYLQEALKELEEEDLRARSVEPAAEQVEALKLLRGASEVLRERWLEGKPPNEWKGVTFKEGQVRKLSLQDDEDEYRFDIVPAEIGKLLALTSLDLSENKALTTLPAEVGRLRALTSLDLSLCKALTTLPAELCGLRALSSLDLRETALKTLPAEVDGLHALSSLDLSYCEALETLPAEVGGLHALNLLDLSYCEALKTLPAEMGGLGALTSLDLSFCRALKTLPAGVGGLHALTSLDLSRCGALKTLPAGMGGLRALTSLKLGGTAITSPPKDLHLDVVAAKAWLHGQHLVAQHSAKQWDSVEMLRCLRDRPGVLHALAEQPAAVDLLRAVLEVDTSLANVTDGDKLGRTPIQHACPECSVAIRAALCLLGRFEIDDGPPLHFSATSAVVQADDLVGADETGAGAGTKPPRRALKAMRKAEQVLAELNGREGLDPKYVVDVLAVYVDESVDEIEFQSIVTAAKQLQGVTVARAPGLEHRLSHELSVRVPASGNAVGSGTDVALQPRLSSTPMTAAHERQAARATGYPFVIVLSLADRNLNTALTHDHVAGNDFPQIRMIMSHLGHALDNLHSKERIHADFKPLNAARELTWKLIDMDVSRKFDETFGTKLPSSGYCPPEMAKVLLAATDAETGDVDTKKLVNYVASVAYDLWSFGVVLFHLCYGISLFNTDQNDNVKMDDLRTLASAPEGPWRTLINKALYPGERRGASIDLKAAASVLRKLLEPDPSRRLEYFSHTGRPMLAVLDEPFFQSQSVDDATLNEIRAEQQKQTAMLTAIDTRTKEIKGLQRATIQLLNEHASSLRACIQAAADDKVPTAFVILVKAPEPNFIKLVKDELGVVKDELAEIGGSATAVIDNRSASEYVSCVEKMTAMYSKANGLASKVKGAISDPAGFLKEQLVLRAVDTLELCLVCEVCWRPQRDDDPKLNGAYDVTTQSDLCVKVMPIAKATLYTIKAVNGLAGIAQCFLPGVPTIPKKILERGSVLLKELDAPSSVAEFDLVQAKLESETKDTDAGKMEGGCLREFTRFLEKEDPKHNWGDLQRALLAEGQSVWCCKDCIGIINEDKNASYEDICDKVKAKAVPLPEVTGDAASPVPAGESKDPSHQAAVQAAVEAAVAKVEAQVAEAEARAEAAESKVRATVGVNGVKDVVEPPLPEVTDAAGAAGAAGEPATDQRPQSTGLASRSQNDSAVELGLVSAGGDLEAKMLRLQAEMKAMKDQPANMSVKICSPCSLL